MMCKLGKCKITIFVLMCMASFGVILIWSWVISFPSYKVWYSHVCACNICLTDRDPWFRARMKSSPQLFLSKGHNIEVDDFKWWMRLQEGRRNFKLYNRTLYKLFEIFPPIPAVARTSPNRCGSCAVVGNSGNLKGSTYGPLIDFHDIVIRMNQGHTRGFEADVGSKTTHHVMYPESAIRLDNTSRLLFVAFKIKDLLWLQNQFNPNAKTTKRIANKDLVMILNPAFIRYVHEAWLEKKGRYPSTGFLTIALSMQMCDEVHVFGFGADRNGNWIHYFEQLKPIHLGTGPHDGNHEYEVIQKLHQKRKIVFFAPQ